MIHPSESLQSLQFFTSMQDSISAGRHGMYDNQKRVAYQTDSEYYTTQHVIKGCRCKALYIGMLYHSDDWRFSTLMHPRSGDVGRAYRGDCDPSAGYLLPCSVSCMGGRGTHIHVFLPQSRSHKRASDIPNSLNQGRNFQRCGNIERVLRYSVIEKFN